MSVRNRIDEARMLFDAGHDHAALILVATAIAASSRLKYPKSVVKSDKEAFVRYLDERLNYIFLGFESPAPFMTYGDDERRVTIGEIIYVEFRCNLVHEAGLPEGVDIVSDKSPTLSHGDGKTQIGRGWLPILFNAVIHDPQHRHIFDDLRRPMYDDLVFDGDGWKDFADRYFLSAGRLHLLQQFIAAFGLDNAQKASPEELKQIWNTEVIPFPERYGLNRGGFTGLRRASGQFGFDAPSVLNEAEAWPKRLYLTDHGAEAIIELSKNLRSSGQKLQLSSC